MQYVTFATIQPMSRVTTPRTVVSSAASSRARDSMSSFLLKDSVSSVYSPASLTGMSLMPPASAGSISGRGMSSESITYSMENIMVSPAEISEGRSTTANPLPSSSRVSLRMPWLAFRVVTVCHRLSMKRDSVENAWVML